MFTRMLKRILIFLCVAGVLFSIGLGGEFHSFWIFLLSLVICAFVLLLFGVFTELCNNVQDIRNSILVTQRIIESILHQMEKNQNSMNTSTSTTNTTVDFQTSADTSITASKQIPYSKASALSMWTCAKCGRGNAGDRISCESCKEKREELSVIPDNCWRCNNCYTIVGNEYKSCWYCGQINTESSQRASAEGAETYDKQDEKIAIQAENNGNQVTSINKTCPKCGKLYYDASFLFCDACGTKLI